MIYRFGTLESIYQTLIFLDFNVSYLNSLRESFENYCSQNPGSVQVQLFKSIFILVSFVFTRETRTVSQQQVNCFQFNILTRVLQLSCF